MATFIKFSNGDTICTSNIQEFRKSVKYLSGPGFGSLHNTKEQLEARKRPAIQVLHDQGKELMLGYESEAERDGEFTRIEAIIHAKPQVVFSNLSLNLSIVQSVHVNHGYYEVTISLNVGNPEPIKIRVSEHDKAEMENARNLLAHFGLEMPISTDEQMAQQYDEKGNSKEPRGF